MGYKEQFDEAMASGKATELTVGIVKFTEEGQMLTGRLLSTRDFSEGDFEQNALCYLLDTDIGRQSCVLGSATDKQIADSIAVGDVIRIVFHGQIEIEGGRRVNKFEVLKLDA